MAIKKLGRKCKLKWELFAFVLTSNMRYSLLTLKNHSTKSEWLDSGGPVRCCQTHGFVDTPCKNIKRVERG